MTITHRNLDGYGAPPIEWDRVKAVLDGELTQAPGSGGPERHTVWLATINPDGSPHVTAIGMSQDNGGWYFTSGPATRKSRNLAHDPRCVFSVATEPFDLVIEGVARRVTSAGELASVADSFVRGGWPCEVAGDALTAQYSAQSAGPAPWHVYRMEPSAVVALGTCEPFGATKFQLGEAKFTTRP